MRGVAQFFLMKIFGKWMKNLEMGHGANAYHQAIITFKKKIQCKTKYLEVHRGRASYSIKVNNEVVDTRDFLEKTTYDIGDTVTLDIDLNTSDAAYLGGIFLFYDVEVLN